MPTLHQSTEIGSIRPEMLAFALFELRRVQSLPALPSDLHNIWSELARALGQRVGETDHARTTKSSTKLPAAQQERHSSNPYRMYDRVIYPDLGVAQIVSIEEKIVGETVQRFYCLRILGTDMRIRVPVDENRETGLREVVSPEKIKSLFDILHEKTDDNVQGGRNLSYRSFMLKIASGDLFSVAEVFRDLSDMANLKYLSFGEQRMLNTTKSLLVVEIMHATGGSKESVEQILQDVLENRKFSKTVLISSE